MSDLNPFDDAAPWGTVFFDDIPVLATLIEVDGAHKPEEWQVTKGSGSSGATTDWKGTKPAEKVKLKFRVTTGEEFDDQGRLRDQLRPNLGKKPPTLNLSNAIVNWGGIAKVCLHEPAFPKWVPDKGAWDFEWELIESAPSKPAKTGPTDPSKPESSTEKAGAQSPAEKELQQLLKEAKSL